MDWKRFLNLKHVAIIAGALALMAMAAALRPIPPAIVAEEPARFGWVRPFGGPVRHLPESARNWSYLSDDLDLEENHRFTTGMASAARIQLGKAHQLVIEPDSRVNISSTGLSPTVTFETGGMTAEISGHVPLLVRGGGEHAVELISVDARLRVEGRNHDELAVTVMKGSIEARVSNGEERITAEAGRKFRVHAGRLSFVENETALRVPEGGGLSWDRGMPVRFAWKTSRKPPGRPTFEISTDPFFRNVIQRSAPPGLEHEKTLVPGYMYFWKVIMTRGTTSTSAVHSLIHPLMKGPSVATDAVISARTDLLGRVRNPVRFAWSDPSWSDRYELQISETRDFSTPVVVAKSARSRVSVRNLKRGRYYWRVVSSHRTREDLVSEVASLRIESANPLRFDDPAPDSSSPAERGPAEAVPTGAAPEPLKAPRLLQDFYGFEWAARGLDSSPVAAGFVRTATPELTWEQIEGADGYVLETSLWEDFRLIRNRVSTAEPRWIVSDPAPVQFFARVSARRGDESATSAVAKVRVILAPPLIREPEPAPGPSGLPVAHLRWTAHPATAMSEIQISRDPAFRNFISEKTRLSEARFQIREPGPKYFRVRSLNRQGWPVSAFSTMKRIELPSGEGFIPILDEIDLKRPDLLSEAPSSSELPLSRYWKTPKFRVWAGVGANYLRFEQHSDSNVESGEFAKLMAPILMASIGFGLTDHLSLVLEYHDWPGSITTRPETQIDRKDYHWKSMLAEIQYRFFERERWFASVLFGVQTHHVPFISVHIDGAANLLENEIRNLSLGLKANYFESRNLEYEIFMRYQSLISSASLNQYDFKATPQLVFDGSLGMSKRYDSGLRLGVYWFGQYQSYVYEFMRDGRSAAGRQTFFNSNLQLRIGYDFFAFTLFPFVPRRRRRKESEPFDRLS